MSKIFFLHIFLPKLLWTKIFLLKYFSDLHFHTIFFFMTKIFSDQHCLGQKSVLNQYLFGLNFLLSSAKHQLQLSWVKPYFPHWAGQDRPRIVSRFSYRLAISALKGTRGLLRPSPFTKSNQNYQIILIEQNKSA